MRVRDYGLGIGLELGTTVGLGLEIVLVSWSVSRSSDSGIAKYRREFEAT